MKTELMWLLVATVVASGCTSPGLTDNVSKSLESQHLAEIDTGERRKAEEAAAALESRLEAVDVSYRRQSLNRTEGGYRLVFSTSEVDQSILDAATANSSFSASVDYRVSDRRFLNLSEDHIITRSDGELLIDGETVEKGGKLELSGTPVTVEQVGEEALLRLELYSSRDVVEVDTSDTRVRQMRGTYSGSLPVVLSPEAANRTSMVLENYRASNRRLVNSEGDLLRMEMSIGNMSRELGVSAGMREPTRTVVVTVTGDSRDEVEENLDIASMYVKKSHIPSTIRIYRNTGTNKSG